MTGRNKSKYSINIGTILSVCLMIFCLTFLTSLNFFIYSPDNEVITQNASPAGPTEEKACNTGFSLAEEILHETSFEFGLQLIDQLCLHHIAEADKLEIFHPELILQPPKA
jgi:hypothetical protein